MKELIIKIELLVVNNKRMNCKMREGPPWYFMQSREF